MKFVIAGGTGHIGTLLTRHFRRDGHRVVVLSRNVEAQAVLWDGKSLGDWVQTLDGADVVINLAGRSVDARYSAATKAEIIASRVDSTRVIGEAIALVANPPRLWLQASTATIYAHSYDRANDEYSGTIGGHEPDVPEAWHFSTDVAKAWEQALDDANTPSTRKVKMRTSVVMSPERGGAFHAILRHSRLGFGRFGDGRQYMSWIHELDFIRAVEWLIAHNELEGAINISAPNPVPNAEFMEELRRSWGQHLAVPTYRPLLEIGAFLMRTEPELVLKSRRVVPARLLESGFTFDFPEWRDAARDLCMRKKEGSDSCETRPSSLW
ncbi:MAG TPA: TIGR01777 family oxidoreductase [Thermoanaerobaculia bacterium]|nr:TIGR01777 family oxidoreductase [Thermoanaerobaculia bacterium]